MLIRRNTDAGVCHLERNHLGGASPSAAVQALAADNRLVAFCPETVGGLPTPRPAAERQSDGRMRTGDGQWQTVDNGPNGTVVNGLNNQGKLVGFFTDGAGNTHGMIVTVTP